MEDRPPPDADSKGILASRSKWPDVEEDNEADESNKNATCHTGGFRYTALAAARESRDVFDNI
jgi:hypothetical protein